MTHDAFGHQEVSSVHEKQDGLAAYRQRVAEAGSRRSPHYERRKGVQGLQATPHRSSKDRVGRGAPDHESEEGEVMKVGDLVRIARPFLSYQGQMGVITKVPRTDRGRWAILLTCGELVATMNKENIEVINGSR